MYRTGNTACDERVKAALAACAERDRLHARRASLELELAVVAAELTRQRELVADERADVERYQGGVWGFLYDLFADRDGRLDKERRELAAATARHDETASEHARLQQAFDDLVRRLDALTGADDELAAARAAKRAELEASGGDVAEQLTRLEDEAAAQRARAVALDEAEAAGRRLQATLARLTVALDSASSWGTLDLVSDSFLVSMVKRGRMDEARGLAGLVQAELSMFRVELADVGLRLDAGVTALPDHGRFVDVWLDNIFTDLSAQSRIGEARATTGRVTTAVSGALGELGGLRHDLEQRARTVADSLRQLTDGAGG